MRFFFNNYPVFIHNAFLCLISRLLDFDSEYQELWDWLIDMESLVMDSHDLMMSEEQQQHLYKVRATLPCVHLAVSLSQGSFVFIVCIMVSIRIPFPVPKLLSIPSVLTGCTDIITARKSPLSHSVWCDSTGGQSFIFKMNSNKWNHINKKRLG